jgi:hypothetical protein
MVVSEDNKLNVIKDLYVHWDKSYWYSVYIFLIIQGLIIVSLTEVLKATGAIANENMILSLLVLSGIFLSILWCFVLNRKFSYIYHSREKLKGILGSDIWDNIKLCEDFKKKFWYFSFINNNVIINKVLMTGFILLWIVIGFFININFILMFGSIIILCIIIWLFKIFYMRYDKGLKKGKIVIK